MSATSRRRAAIWSRASSRPRWAKLRRGPDGQIGSGLGQTTSLGTVTLIPPNLEVTATGQEEVVDGIRMVENGVLNHRADREHPEADAAKLGELLGLLDQPDPGFAIVTP